MNADITKGPRSHYVDFTEFKPAGVRQSLRASDNGILIEAVQVTRVVGVDTARQMARMLNLAADEAEKRGAPAVVTE